MYRLNLWFIFLVIFLELPATSYAREISCWQCEPALDTCLYYAETRLEVWYAGCDIHYQECQANGLPDCDSQLAACRALGAATYASDFIQCYARYNRCVDRCSSPIIINLDRGGFRMTGVDDPVEFDIDGDGESETLSWTDPGSACAFLVLDRNGNGTVDDGTELFGDHTPQPPSANPGGFAALGLYDQADSGGDGDGWISVSDAVL